MVFISTASRFISITSEIPFQSSKNKQETRKISASLISLPSLCAFLFLFAESGVKCIGKGHDGFLSPLNEMCYRWTLFAPDRVILSLRVALLSLLLGRISDENAIKCQNMLYNIKKGLAGMEITPIFAAVILKTIFLP